MASDKHDYYEVLGIPRDASADSIRAAYRKLARKYHPDVNKEPDAEARFKEINEAYQVLSNEQQKAIYDRYGHAGLSQNGMGGAGPAGFGGFGDIFEEFFGFGTRGAARQGPRRGGDLRYDLEIEFEEAVFGCEKQITLTRLATCPNCRGSGAEPGTSPMRCPQCGGTGQTRTTQQSLFGSFVNVSTCPRCNGRGEVTITPCSMCHGAQHVEQSTTLSVSIPAGVDDGNRIRLTGEGDTGTNGGPAGNLYVILYVRPHAYFRRQQDNIHLDLTINIAQAALGDEITIPTLDGKETLSIPAGTQTGSVFRLRGRGVPHVRGGGRGDQIVVINVAIPTDLDARQRELFGELGKTLGREVISQGEKSLVDRFRDALGL